MWICVNICCENIRISVCMHGAQVCVYAFLQTISHNSCIFMHVNCAEFMLINTAELRSTCIYAKSMQKPCTNSMCMCTRMHAFSSAALSSVHIFKKCTYSHVCVCARARVWSSSSDDRGGVCEGVRPAAYTVAVANVEVDFVSPLCTPLCRLLPSAYTSVYSHTYTCVCVCVCTGTHISRWKAVNGDVYSRLRTCVCAYLCVFIHTHTRVFIHTRVCVPGCAYTHTDGSRERDREWVSERAR
jgi:hypothetical protein